MKTLCAVLVIIVAIPLMAGRQFNGTSDKIQAGGGSLLLNAAGATVVCSFLVTSLPGATEVDVCSNGGKEGSGHQGPFVIEIGSTASGGHDNQIGAVWWQNQPLNHNVDLHCSFTISINTWYTVVATFQSNTTLGATLAVNGTSCGSSNTNTVLGVQSGTDVPDFCVAGVANSGNPGTCAAPNFAGLVANFYVYATHLSNAQALALSLVCPAGVSSRRMAFPSPARAWPLTGASGLTIEPDLSGNGFSATLTGTAPANHPPCAP